MTQKALFIYKLVREEKVVPIFLCPIQTRQYALVFSKDDLLAPNTRSPVRFLLFISSQPSRIPLHVLLLVRLAVDLDLAMFLGELRAVLVGT